LIGFDLIPGIFEGREDSVLWLIDENFAISEISASVRVSFGLNASSS
jgi:hypothetical protein